MVFPFKMSSPPCAHPLTYIPKFCITLDDVIFGIDLCRQRACFFLLPREQKYRTPFQPVNGKVTLVVAI
jgi:hypothetical protein